MDAVTRSSLKAVRVGSAGTKVYAAEATRVCVAQVLRTTGDHFNAVWDTKLLIEIV